MPIYEYECTLCRFRFEHRQGFEEEPTSLCPRCQGKARRVLHSVPVIFKGSGFYITDQGKGASYTNPKKPEEKEAEKPAKRPADESLTAKGD